jgi:hypothetical protein
VRDGDGNGDSINNVGAAKEAHLHNNTRTYGQFIKCILHEEKKTFNIYAQE